LVYQGKFEEYPILTARGEEFESFVLIPGDGIIIDHFNIDVYVKNINTDKWEEWTRSTSLYLESTEDKKYEVRFNENKRYELKFGNDINGKKLNVGDQIAVYYLKSEAAAGEVGAGGIDGAKLLQLHTVSFTDIFNTVKDSNIDYLTDVQIGSLQFTNTNSSSLYYEGETVSDIRSRAPDSFSSQYRLVTKADYESYIKQHFSNTVKDVKVVNNWDHLDGHMKYLIDTVGLKSDNLDPNTLYNQVTFADSCDFNNVYIYAIPRLEQSVTSTVRTNYLGPAQKTAIIDSVRDTKTLTTETIIMDPVYMAVDIGATTSAEGNDEAIANKTKLKLVRELNSARSFESIKNSAYTIIKNYIDGLGLGETIYTATIATDLLNIEGVKSIKTIRTDTALELDGLNLLVWNPIYPHDDIDITASNVTLPYFKYAYLNNPAGLLNKITVVAESTSTGSAEF
jgi:hypothetical protein